jgi:hypothetical protein
MRSFFWFAALAFAALAGNGYAQEKGQTTKATYMVRGLH